MDYKRKTTVFPSIPKLLAVDGFVHLIYLLPSKKIMLHE